MTKAAWLGIALCAVIIAAQPFSPGQAAYERANSLFVAGKFPEALAAADEALRLDAKLIPALTLKAKLAMAAKRYDVARQSLQRALAIDPKAPYAQFLYGMEAYLNNEMTDAMSRFRRARELSPNDPRAALYLGLASESIGRPQEALALYREAIRLEQAAGRPQADTLLPAARLLTLLGRADQAEGWIRQAVKLSPRSRDAHFELARWLLRQGQAAQAAAEGEIALGLADGTTVDTAIHYLLIRAWKQAGQPDRADSHAAVIRAQENAPPAAPLGK